MSRSRRRSKRSGRRRRKIYYVVLIIAVAIVMVTAVPMLVSYVGDYLAREAMLRALASRPDCSSMPKRALIVDSLSLDFPNASLVEEIRRILESAGYSVDVKTGSEATPDLYARLNQYQVVILRIHGGKADITVGGQNIRINGLFTGLEWRDEYQGFKQNGTGTRAFPYNSTKAYLALLPDFFDKRLEGMFCRGSIVVVASCFSLYTRDIADVLATKGLSYYVGFEDAIALDYMDRSLETLVNLVFRHNMSIEDAVDKIYNELGADPFSGSYMELIHYIS